MGILVSAANISLSGNSQGGFVAEERINIDQGLWVFNYCRRDLKRPTKVKSRVRIEDLLDLFLFFQKPEQAACLPKFQDLLFPGRGKRSKVNFCGSDRHW